MRTSYLIAACAAALLTYGSFPVAAQGIVTTRSAGFGTYTTQTDTLNKLTCNVNGAASLGANHTGTFRSTGYDLTLGDNADFGGIATELRFTNTANGASANLIQTVSAAGAAWQNSYFLDDLGGDRMIVFNQGAGNAVNQWGFSNTISNLTETGWNPMYSDHYHPHFSKTGMQYAVGTTPCDGNSFKFDDSRSSLVATPLETPYGNAIHITNSFQLRSELNQYWGFEGVEQAFYLNGVVAAQSNMAAVLVGKSGWVEVVGSPWKSFSIKHGSGSCTASGCSYGINSDIDYVLLYYTIGGQGYGIIVRDPYPYGMILANGTPTCTPSSNPEYCGAIQIHTWMAPSGAVGIPQGEIRDYRVEYYAGTGAQLGALGFDIFTGATVNGGYTGGRAANCNKTTAASTNNQLVQDPVTNLVTHNGMYSSKSFQGNRNNNGTYVNMATPVMGSGHVQLVPRTLSGTPYGFPSTYHLWTITTDEKTPIDLGIYNTQPDKNNIVDIPLGYKLDVNQFAIVPVTLGEDNFRNYYLQMAAFSGCN